jgi:hypothetical protein
LKRKMFSTFQLMTMRLGMAGLREGGVLPCT